MVGALTVTVLPGSSLPHASVVHTIAAQTASRTMVPPPDGPYPGERASLLLMAATTKAHDSVLFVHRLWQGRVNTAHSIGKAVRKGSDV
jgi:hypothetical protein